jgi:hypothetical protein
MVNVQNTRIIGDKFKAGLIDICGLITAITIIALPIRQTEAFEGKQVLNVLPRTG